MLFVKVISTPYPPRKEPPENVMRGPGLLLQSYAEKSAEMVTGIGRLVLLMWGNDDDDAAKDGDVMGALDDPSVHAPARKSAPSRAAALRSVPVHMVASLSQRCGRLRRRGGPGSTSKARQGESDHAIADTAPHRRQRRVDAESTTGLRSQQLGQTAYFPSSAAGAASSGLRRTRDHMGGRSGRICRKARGTRSRRLFTSSTVSPGVSSTTRYHAPRRNGQSIPARTRAQYCTCGMRALRATVDLRIQGVRAPGGRACHIMSAAGGLGL